jgi:hypothetical protein
MFLFRNRRVGGRPLRVRDAPAQFFFTDFRGNAIRLGLDFNGDRDFRSHDIRG